MAPYLCGTAKVDITPEEKLLDQLYGLMDSGFAGIIDRLQLRVVALAAGEQKALLISFDLDKAPNPKTWLPEIAERTGIPEENILYIGTHTHSAPTTTERDFEPSHAGPEQKAAMKKYEDMIHTQLLSAVDAALVEMIPARIGTAVGESHINVNRNADLLYTAPDGTEYPYVGQGPNFASPVDRDLFVMKIESESGLPLAFFTNYAVHCCVMFCNDYDGNRRMGICGDIAGNISAALEEKFPSAVAIWSSGAAGDVNPIMMNAVMYPKAADGSYVIDGVGPWTSTKKLLDMLVGWHFKDTLDTVRRITCDEEEGVLQGAVEWSETPGDNVGQDLEHSAYRIRLHALRIGETTIFGIGGELYSYFGRLVKKLSPAKQTVIVNHDASLIMDAGYIHDDASIERISHKAPIFAMVPGGEPHARMGYLEDSIRMHTQSLANKVCN